MRQAWLLAIALGCGPAPVVAPPAVHALRRLPPPAVVDATSPEAAYRAAVAAALLPAWTQFLEDCRVRLSFAHPLNDMTLEATATLDVDATGRIEALALTSSGNADFDRAVRQLLRDNTPLVAPPPALLGDDDRVHLRWVFARDRRQAGAATATVESRRLPIEEVAQRLILGGDLARLATRIVDEPPSAARIAAIAALMNAVLVEAVQSSDLAVRHDALDAIAAARITELAGPVDAMLAATRTSDTRFAAMRAASALGLTSEVQAIADQLRVDITTDQHLASAEIDALIALDAVDEARSIARAALRKDRPNPNVLHALSALALPDAAPLVVTWSRTGDVRVREAACAALAAVPDKVAWPALRNGVRDRDASVRARCLSSIGSRAELAVETSPHALARGAGKLPDDPLRAGLVRAVSDATRDRDSGVRAAAVIALAMLDRRIVEQSGSVQAPPDLSKDRAPAVRAAYARALAIVGGASEVLTILLADPDPDVRTSAWRAFVATKSAPSATWRAQLATASRDPAPGVRAIAASRLDDLDALDHLANDDDDGMVRTRALVRAATIRGRAASEFGLLEKIAAAPPASADRVRVALAWHLAR